MKTDIEAYRDGGEVIPTGFAAKLWNCFPPSTPLSSLFPAQFEWQHVGGTIMYEKK